jgi:hypothetical protein
MVGLTPAGHQLWSRTIDIDRRVRRYLRAGTTRAERDQLDAILARIERNVEAIPPAARHTA